MKLSHKLGIAALGLSTLLPSIVFAESSASVQTNIRVEANGKVATSSTNIKINASSTKKDSIRERLDVIKAQAREEKEENKGEAVERKETLKSEIDAKRTQIKNDFDEKRSDAALKARNNIKSRISSFTDKLIERYEAAIERLGKLVERIETRIAKMEAEGANVVEAKSSLTTAKLKISAAASSTAVLKLKVGTFMSSSATSTDDLRVGYAGIKESADAAKTAIKEAHNALVRTVASLKPGRNKNDKTATSSPATTTATTTP
jgi:hypothetical protein